MQSDTEFEVQKITQDSEVGDDKTHTQSWRWGELPSPPHDGPLNASIDASNPNNESMYLKLKKNFFQIILMLVKTEILSFSRANQ